MTNPNEPITGGFWANSWHEGLTKREYFAAMAMQGIFAGNQYTVRTDFPERCQKAVEIADALIKELSK